MNSILTWLATLVLKFILSATIAEIERIIAEGAKNESNAEVDAKNLAKLQAAKDREERTRAALDLLNGNS